MTETLDERIERRLNDQPTKDDWKEIYEEIEKINSGS